ncbi:hypothetical protein Salmuc_00683 [Salipiger mucosus DSM 16094]|uniref:Uncharacterized protein n=1 Tax=Salipiger mucosus DSM 16094 TaxID=1123237 RepID=S9Q3Y7_9RHOB|nr:hypothetical protein Salmuc_00683 [Salipiger mucosus DSM 16094]
MVRRRRCPRGSARRGAIRGGCRICRLVNVIGSVHDRNI